MLIGNIAKESKAAISCKLDQSIINDLTEYKAYYEKTYGSEISQNSLVEELLRHVLQKDKKFQSFKKQKISKSIS